MSKLMMENEFLLEEARARYEKLSLFVKSEAGPVLMPIMLALENLTAAVCDLEKLKKPAAPEERGEG